MPALVLVGDNAAPPKMDCHAPFCPEAAHATLVPETSPLVSACRQLLAVPVMVLRVRAPATVMAPLNLEVPNTPRVVVGRAVPIPTLPSLVFTTKELFVPIVVVLVMIVEVATVKP